VAVLLLLGYVLSMTLVKLGVEGLVVRRKLCWFKNFCLEGSV
jgi:hypothetical protein